MYIRSYIHKDINMHMCVAICGYKHSLFILDLKSTAAIYRRTVTIHVPGVLLLFRNARSSVMEEERSPEESLSPSLCAPLPPFSASEPSQCAFVYEVHTYIEMRGTGQTNIQEGATASSNSVSHGMSDLNIYPSPCVCRLVDVWTDRAP